MNHILAKNRGGGTRRLHQPKPFPIFPQGVNIQHTATPVYPEQRRGASPIFSCVYLTPPVTRGWRGTANSFPSRAFRAMNPGCPLPYISRASVHGSQVPEHRPSLLRAAPRTLRRRSPRPGRGVILFPAFPLKFQALRPSNIPTPLFHYSLPTTHYALFTTHGPPQNFYPPAPNLRHNPAAQGRIKVQLNDWAQPNPHTGRIQ